MQSHSTRRSGARTPSSRLCRPRRPSPSTTAAAARPALLTPPVPTLPALTLPALTLPALTLALATLTACGGGGGGAAPLRPAGNLRAESMTVRSTTPTAAHEMELATRILATAEFADVPVSYYLMLKDDVEAQKDPVRQVLVGSSVFAKVTAGTADYVSTVVIPTGVQPAGDWYLIAQVDPENVILETNEDDNMPTDGSKIEVRVDDTNSTRWDVVLESADIDQDAITLWPDGAKKAVGNIADVTDHDLSSTLVMTTTGPKDAENVDITATIAVPGEGVYQLVFWDEASSTYVNRLFTTITPGVPNTIHADMAIPGGARRKVDTYLRTQKSGMAKFTVTFSSNMLNNVAEWENGSQRHQRPDNKIDADVVIALPPVPPVKAIAWERSFRKDWRNDVFRVGVDFRAAAGLTKVGATGDTRAVVPLTLFGKRVDLLDFRSHARVLPRQGQPTDSDFGVDLLVLGQTVYSRASEDPQLVYTEDWSIARTSEVRGKVFAGPVPIDVLAGTTGTLGFRMTTTLDPARFEIEAVPYAKAEAYAEASVNAVVVKVGVRGRMTLLGDEFSARATAAVTAPSTSQIDGTLTFQLTNTLTGPNGRLWLFAERKVPKWCWQVVPCGIETVTDEHTLVRFSSFRKVDVLFHDEKRATVDL